MDYFASISLWTLQFLKFLDDMEINRVRENYHFLPGGERVSVSDLKFSVFSGPHFS